MLLGAIDVGTNSIHLIVVELDPHYGTARTLLKTREMVRLGAGDALARGYLGKKAVARGVAAIARFADAARAAGASDVRAVATSAVREASNRDEFVAAVRAASGVTLEVLDDVEEARLIHLGVSRGFALDGRLACIFDIGGGSTELIIGDAARSYYLHSVRLGSLRLFERYLADGASGGYPALEQHVRKEIAPVATALREYGFDVLVGTSGTLMGLAALDAADAGLALQRVHGYVLRVERLRALQRTMLRLSPADRRRLPGMNPRRCDIIVAGNAIAIALAEAVERDEIVVSERALREGLVVDYLERNLALARTLGDERTRVSIRPMRWRGASTETAFTKIMSERSPCKSSTGWPNCTASNLPIAIYFSPRHSCTTLVAQSPQARTTNTARISCAALFCPAGAPKKSS